MSKLPASAVFASRLKARRTELGLSQAELGVRMGLPEDVASTRINRYEKGVHAPDLDTMERMAHELGVPVAYLLTKDERLAGMILGFSELPLEDQDRILSEIGKALEKQAAAKTKGERATPKRSAAKAKVRRRTV
jgi:transcriptional regulator with XRE-family HTH domain